MKRYLCAHARHCSLFQGNPQPVYVGEQTSQTNNSHRCHRKTAGEGQLTPHCRSGGCPLTCTIFEFAGPKGRAFDRFWFEFNILVWNFCRLGRIYSLDGRVSWLASRLQLGGKNWHNLTRVHGARRQIVGATNLARTIKQLPRPCSLVLGDTSSVFHVYTLNLNAWPFVVQ